MNVTIFPTGAGGAQSAVNYLLSDKDHLANKRSVEPEILFGDPESFVAHTKAGKKKQRIPKIYQSDGKLVVSVTGTPGEKFLLELFSGATKSQGAMNP